MALAGCGAGTDSTGSTADLAIVAGKAITTSDLERYEQGLADYLRSEKEGVEAHRDHLQSLVDRELMLFEATKRGLDKQPSLEHDLTALVNERIADELSQSVVAGHLSVTEEEIRTAYEEHLLGWEIRPAHILSKTEEDAIEIIRLLKAGTDFYELAKERSLADDADKGGDLGGFFGPGDAVTALREGVFRLEEGQVSQPIQTMDGYEVVKVIQKRRTPVELLSREISQQLTQRKKVKRLKAVVDSLEAAWEVRYHRDRIRHVLDRLNGRELGQEEAQAPLIEYSGGAVSVEEAAVGLRFLDKGATPPDSAMAFRVLEIRIVPDTLLTLEARARGLHQRGNLLAWKEQKRREKAVAQLRLDVIAGKVEITSEEVRAYFDSHIDRYTSLPGIIEMTEVLTDTRAEAAAILARARAGERLEELAARHSIRPDMEPLGGHALADSGRMTIESLYMSPYREIFGDANTQDVGLLKGPLAVQGHYSVFRLDQPYGKTPVPFRRVRRPIRVNLRQREEAVHFQVFLDSLREASTDQVQASEEALVRYAESR